MQCNQRCLLTTLSGGFFGGLGQQLMPRFHEDGVLLWCVGVLFPLVVSVGCVVVSGKNVLSVTCAEICTVWLLIC